MTQDKFYQTLRRAIGRTTIFSTMGLAIVCLLVHSAHSNISAVIDPQFTELPSQVHDFGIVLPLSKSKFTFVTKNTFSDVLTIDKLDRSCGCTSALCTRSVASPGENVSVNAVLSAHDHAELMSSRITVHGHVGRQAIKIEFQLLANVENIIEFPDNGGSCLSMGSWSADQLPAHTSVQVVRGKYPLTFDQLRVDCDSPALSVTVSPVSDKSWNILFHINSADVMGATGLPVTFRFLSKGRCLPESVTRQAFIEILGPITATPSSLLFTLSPAEHIQKTIEITDRLETPNARPPQIVAISATGKNMLTTWKNDPTQTRVIIDYTAPAQLGQERGEIVISVKDQGKIYKVKVSYLALIS
jgi:hypothetical protein